MAPSETGTTQIRTAETSLGKTRLGAITTLLADAHRRLGLKLGFLLWDGSCVPVDWPADGLMIRLADEGVIASLVRRPKPDTLIKLHVAGRIDVVNGTIFDLVAARPEGKVMRGIRSVSKLAALNVIRHFWRADRGPPSVLDRIAGDEIDRDGKPATNKANVAYHYDVSNDFYRLFLDSEMVYTCAYFTEDHGDIARAQRDKLDMICRKLRLRPGDRFLDIGCGWGALVCHAAQHFGVEAHGVTLAEEQLKLAQEKVSRLGLDARVTLHLKDYTQMEGQFDKIASIGMFEQVGIKNHPAYFQTVNRLLRPRGLYLHHTIARRAKKTDRAFARMSAEYRALVRYIFPGGELDHLGMSITNLERAGFEVHDVEGWREHYQRTTWLWWQRLHERRSEAEALVGPDKTRMWLLYLAGCSLAFQRGGAFINQTLVSKRSKGPSGLPFTRADLYG
jgi:cyclopropane-fatty-acyl-phospholipid synthase